MVKTNLSIFVNGKNIGKPVLGQGARSFSLVLEALLAARVPDFNVMLFEDKSLVQSITRLNGEAIKNPYEDLL